LVEEEGIEPVWHRSSTDYGAYAAPCAFLHNGASPENRISPAAL